MKLSKIDIILLLNSYRPHWTSVIPSHAAESTVAEKLRLLKEAIAVSTTELEKMKKAWKDWLAEEYE